MQGTTLNKMDRVFGELEQRILNGHWKAGEQIPTEAQLANEFHCSIGTVSKAIARLTHLEMVERRTRAGTRVIHGTGKQSGSSLDACAFIYPNHQHEGISRTVWGFQQAANQEQRRTLMLPTGTDFRKEAEIIGRLGEFNVRGAVVYPVIPTPKDQIYYRQMIMACRFPIVLVGINLPGTGCPAVISDGQHAGYTMTQHLLKQGLTRIGFLANYAWVPSTRDRYLGYRLAMTEAGLNGEGDDVLLETSMNPNFDNLLDEPTRLARTYLEPRTNLEGVVCANDFLAHGCLTVARELGLDVPRQIRIAGIDGFDTLPQTSPALTTYRMQFEEVGRRAFLRLSGMKGISADGLPLETLVPGEIVVRESA
jgi:GntR family transcriptional regulator, arabinose operon transcriptional repressor